MSPKMINFVMLSWFISILICVILEGTSFGAHGSDNVLNQLNPITTYSIGGVDFLCFNFQFFTGLKKVLFWDYSFYTGAFQILRRFWFAVFTPPVAYGIWSATAPIIATFFSRILGIL